MRRHNYCVCDFKKSKMRSLFPIAIFLIFFSACTKQDVSKEINSAAADSIQAQINYLAKIKANLNNSFKQNRFFNNRFQ